MSKMGKTSKLLGLVILGSLAVVAVAAMAWLRFDSYPASIQPAATATPTPKESCTLAEAYPGRSVDIDDIPKPRPNVFPRSPADTKDGNFDPNQDEWYGNIFAPLV